MITIKETEGLKVGDDLKNIHVYFHKNVAGKVRLTDEVIDSAKITDIDENELYMFATLLSSRSEGIKKTNSYFKKSLIDKLPKRFSIMNGPYKKFRVDLGAAYQGERNIYVGEDPNDYVEEEEVVIGVNLETLPPEPIKNVPTPKAPKSVGGKPVFAIPPAQLPTASVIEESEVVD